MERILQWCVVPHHVMHQRLALHTIVLLSVCTAVRATAALIDVDLLQ